MPIREWTPDELVTWKLRDRREQLEHRLHANLCTTNSGCRGKSDDELRWLAGYIADEIAYHDSKTVKSPNSYRYLLMAREVVGAEQVRRGLPHANGPEYSWVG